MWDFKLKPHIIANHENELAVFVGVLIEILFLVLYLFRNQDHCVSRFLQEIKLKYPRKLCILAVSQVVYDIHDGLSSYRSVRGLDSFPAAFHHFEVY